MFALLATNIWINLYTNLIAYLNFLFPTNLRETFYRPEGVFPEPFEIPVYLSLTLLFVIVILFVIKRSKNPLPQYSNNSFVKITLTLSLFFVFLTKLGPFPLSDSSEPFTSTISKSDSYFYWLIYVVVVGFLIVETVILLRLFKKQSKMILIYLWVLIVICILTFQPGFSITAINYAQYIGPAWEIAQGNTIFTEVPSRYGFLSILVLGLSSRLNLFDLLNLPILIWFLTVIQYFLFFYLINKTSKSLSLSLIGLFSLLTLDYYAYIQSPQSGPMRWLPILLVIFAYFRIRKIDSLFFVILTALLSLWSIDSGVAIILGFLTTLFLLFLNKSLSLQRTAGAILKFGLILSTGLLIINLIYFLLGLTSINYLKLFHDLRAFALSGNSMIPIGYRSYFWLIPLLYFASIIYFLSKASREEVGASNADRDWSTVYRQENSRHIMPVLLILSANLMLFASTYYVGRSAPDYLFKISIFPLLIFFFLISNSYHNLQNVFQRILLLTLLFALLIALPSLYRKGYISEYFKQNYIRLTQINIFKPDIYNELASIYKEETESLKSKIKTDSIVLITRDDTFLLYLLGKSSLIRANPQNDLILTQKDLQEALSNINKPCQVPIIIDCELLHQCRPYRHIISGYPPLEQEIFEKVQNKCAKKLESLSCATKLCIAN